MNPKRLAMMGFRPGHGGMGRVMTTLANQLHKLGIDIDILLPYGDHPDLINIHPSIGTHFITQEDARLAGQEIRQYIRRRKPDAMLSNKDQSSRLILGSIDRAERPLLAIRIGTNVPEKMRRSNPLLAPWRCRQLAKLYAQSDILVGNSSGVSESLKTMIARVGGKGSPPDIVTILNPVDQSTIQTMAGSGCKHDWVNDKTGPLIVSAGRLVRAKNFQLLVKSFAELPATLDAKLIICGEGGQKKALEKTCATLDISDRVDFIGYQPNPFPYIAAADLFVCSSIFEGANNALMEAVTLGVPCISTDCPSGSRDILENGRIGPLTPVNNAVELTRAMRDLLETPPDPSILRASAERFNPETVARQYAQAMKLTTPLPRTEPG